MDAKVSDRIETEKNPLSDSILFMELDCKKLFLSKLFPKIKYLLKSFSTKKSVSTSIIPESKISEF